MTENEAIKLMNDIHSQCCDTANILCTPDADKRCEAAEMAIKALEEVQQYRQIGTPEELQDMKNNYFEALSDWRQYRKIGTLEECRAAMEKQTARKALHQGCYDKNGTWHEWVGINGRPYELCPSCGTNLCCEMPLDRKPEYCKECGQKLDWEG